MMRKATSTATSVRSEQNPVARYLLASMIITSQSRCHYCMVPDTIRQPSHAHSHIGYLMSLKNTNPLHPPLFQRQVLSVLCFGRCLRRNSHQRMSYIISCLLGVRRWVAPLLRQLIQALLRPPMNPSLWSILWEMLKSVRCLPCLKSCPRLRPRTSIFVSKKIENIWEAMIVWYLRPWPSGPRQEPLLRHLREVRGLHRSWSPRQLNLTSCMTQ